VITEKSILVREHAAKQAFFSKNFSQPAEQVSENKLAVAAVRKARRFIQS
tara:strand:+ start:308 stop:457 length:150 start_codon:yes stop_codon:yes gene_type:complete